ncbi:coiled-coil domain-containing protein 66 isoform X2 [Dunckerocampus dactyliophorus]|uniref:coiled-coil domain-containing protein 66 isoform X2 n=1 Tax=Dunckerocampus dactyliophorus TaxID=161453 RepID=UPI002407544A|nr:coiled-coil domain-containing protein 66 isoform X2 [Dunckerocampus dactyliophorus]
MYLGDGLLFELENGKPKLIVLSNGVERNLGKHSFRTRPASIWRSSQPPCMVQEVPARQARQCTSRPRGAKNKAGEGLSFDSSAVAERGVASRTASKTQEHHTGGGRAKVVPKVKSDRHKCSTSTGSLTAGGNTGRTQGSMKAGPKHSQVTENKGQNDTAVCLTGEQVRQILNAVQPSSHDQHTEEEQSVLSCDGHQGGGEMEDRLGWAETKGGETTLISPPKDNRSHGGLFSWLEEREVDTKACVEAKKAQWRRELNEQVALKQQQQHHVTSVRLQSEEDTAQLFGRHREQPAAIRSSLRLGAVTPMEEVLTVERREEQRRRWLEELDRQREETKERRRQEKLLQSQKEDHDLWASHFDSMQRRPPAASPVPPLVPPPVPISVSKRGDWDPSSNLSLAWDASSSCGADSVDRASVDPSSRYTTRSSYLRSMTALLDPVQMEERERRRLKQLEQQRAIQAQVEERRQQREQEEARRKTEEEEEERRLTMEWNILHTKYQEDTHKEQLKEHGCGEVGVKESLELSVLRPADRSSEKRDTAVQTEAPPPLREDSAQTTGVPTPSNVKKRAVRGGKERMCLPEGGGGGGGDPYEAFARTERSNEKRRPEWNTHRPSRRFVPASERYPVTLQRSRQESRLKRQEELLTLQDRNCLSRSGAPPPHQDAQLSSKATQSRTSKVDSNSRNVPAVVSTES